MSDLLKPQEGCDEVIDNELCGIFYEDYKKKYLPFQVFLSKRGMVIRKELENDVVIDISDVVGSKYMGEDKNNKVQNSCGCSLTNRNVKNNLVTTETDNIVYLTIYYYEQNREKRLLTLGFSAHSSYDENFSESEKWHEKIQRLKGRNFLTDAHGTLPMLILLNPKSGSGRASEHFYKQVMPVLVDADLPYQVQVTQQANSCKELISSTKDISKVWKGIIVVGGDGLLWEVLNGLFERHDSSEVLSVLPIGIIPCGSGNGLARTIAHLYQTPFQPKPVINAAISCVSGRTALMDVVRVEMKSKIMYSFLSVGWGFIADVDIESEILRSIGNWRFTLWSLYRAFTLKSYHGILSYKKFNDMNPVSQVNWTVEEGSFIMVHAAYQTHMGEDCFFVPKSKLDDGLIYVVIIREGITRLQLIRFLSAMETGTHIPTTENKFIAIIPVTAFRIEPSGNDGILTVDGERVEYGKIQGEVLPGTVKVMVPK